MNPSITIIFSFFFLLHLLLLFDVIEICAIFLFIYHYEWYVDYFLYTWLNERGGIPIDNLSWQIDGEIRCSGWPFEWHSCKNHLYKLMSFKRSFLFLFISIWIFISKEEGRFLIQSNYNILVWLSPGLTLITCLILWSNFSKLLRVN